MVDTFPDMNWQLNVELGEIPSEYVQRYGMAKAAALFRPTRPRVDAVRWEPDRYLLIEAKLRDIKSGIGDLLYYRNMLPSTPDLPFYKGQPFVFRVVVPWMLEWLQPMATAAGVEVDVKHYDFIDDYVKERQHYFTAEYRAARAEKMRMRQILGVD
jgi:hypothetical protein